MPVAEGARLDYFDKNRIERAIDQAKVGSPPVRVIVEHAGQRYRILVSPLLNKEEVLASRA